MRGPRKSIRIAESVFDLERWPNGALKESAAVPDSVWGDVAQNEANDHNPNPFWKDIREVHDLTREDVERLSVDWEVMPPPAQELIEDYGVLPTMEQLQVYAMIYKRSPSLLITEATNYAFDAYGLGQGDR